jgi:hypothetical protein
MWHAPMPFASSAFGERRCVLIDLHRVARGTQPRAGKMRSAALLAYRREVANLNQRARVRVVRARTRRRGIGERERADREAEHGQRNA